MSAKTVRTLCYLQLVDTFDTVDHEVLLNLFESCLGVGGSALSLLRSYLTQRTQCVSVDNFTFELVTLMYGAPQGSVLGL